MQNLCSHTYSTVCKLFVLKVDTSTMSNIISHSYIFVSLSTQCFPAIYTSLQFPKCWLGSFIRDTTCFSYYNHSPTLSAGLCCRSTIWTVLTFTQSFISLPLNTQPLLVGNFHLQMLAGWKCSNSHLCGSLIWNLLNNAKQPPAIWSTQHQIRHTSLTSTDVRSHYWHAVELVI